MIRYTDDIRSVMTEQDFRDIVVDYMEAYNIDPEDNEIKGMMRAVDGFDKLSDEFLYWVYVTAILEGIIEDNDGYRDDDYLFDLNALCALLGGSYPITDKPTALAYARTQLLLAAPNTASWLNRNVTEEDARRLRTGYGNWDDIERMGMLTETMWRNFLI